MRDVPARVVAMMTFRPEPAARTTRTARIVHIARGARVAVGMLAGAVALGFLVVAAAEPTPGSVLGLGAGTLTYVLASFGMEA
jgi:hypothetical protein